MDQDFRSKVIQMIDGLKSVCAEYGLGNSGDEYKIISQIFLFKFLNDKFVSEFCEILEIEKADFQNQINNMSDKDFDIKLKQIEGVRFKKHTLINNLIPKQNENHFAKILDDTLISIAKDNEKILSIKTSEDSLELAFEEISKPVKKNKNDFARAIINKIQGFDFASMFDQGYDFFANIFEYLVKDYNSNSGGKYAEYYTPHSISRVIAKILVGGNEDLNSIKIYDPSAGTGTLLMCLAHQIGHGKCNVYSQDISQKSTSLLRLNLVLNDNLHSINGISQGNTIKSPQHKNEDFDYIVSNPPFKLDFSGYSGSLEKSRFWAGIPKVPPKKKESMAIYQLFVQHIINKLSNKGKAAIVLPNGFLVGKSIDKLIREKIVNEGLLSGIISMPPNIFADTGTNVSILFLSKNKNKKVILIDATNLGTKEKINGKQKTVLSPEEEDRIINVFHNKKSIDDFSVIVETKKVKENDYSLSPSMYIKTKEEIIDKNKIKKEIDRLSSELNTIFKEFEELVPKVKESIKKLKSK